MPQDDFMLFDAVLFTGKTRMAAKPTDIVSVKLRMREGLRRQIAADAKKAKHSINQEMVRRLERSYLADDMKLAIHIAAEEAAKLSVEAVLRTLIERQEGKANG